MQNKFVMAIDQGTTSTRAMIFNHSGLVVGVNKKNMNNITLNRVGLTRYINRGYIARAVLEATAYQTREVSDAMEQDSGVKLKALKVDGGMVINQTLMQFQADILDVPVIRPKVAETTSLGAAYAAGLAVGYWKDVDALSQNW